MAMMDETYLGNDGKAKTLRRFFDFDEEYLGPRVTAALRDPDVEEIRIVKVGHNEPCPCGSGEKFKKCCLWKVNCGVEIVTAGEGESDKQ